MEEIQLKAQLREKTGGKGVLAALRKKSGIPAVVYGGKKPPVSVEIPEKDFLKLIKRGSNAIIKIEYPGSSDTVIVKKLQYHVVTDRLIHVDFHRISLTEKIEVEVHIRLNGEAPGVKLHGGILEHPTREIKVRCLPTAIPKEIPVDISLLDMGGSILVKDITVPEGVEILEDMSNIIASIVTAKEEEVAVPAADAAAAAAEPEVVAAKGKKDEETAEGEKKEAPAADKKPAEKKPAEKK